MRDLRRRRFNSNNPQANYVKLKERIDGVEARLKKMGQLLLDGMCRITELEDRSR